MISVSKLSGNIQHQFTCNGIPCTNQTVTLNHLLFG